MFQEQLRAGDMSAIERDVIAQVEGGADVLDINMGVPLTDEPELLSKAITLVQTLTDLPVCIDSSVVEALEAGLAAYQGRALVNSITAEDDRMEQILPLVKKHDGAIIALPDDAEEIPVEADRRLELVEHIVEVASAEYGIAIENIVIDPLAMPIGADQQVVAVTMDTRTPTGGERGEGCRFALGTRRVGRQLDLSAPETAGSHRVSRRVSSTTHRAPGAHPRSGGKRSGEKQ